MNKLLLIILPVFFITPAVAIPTYAAESQVSLDGPGPGFRADVSAFAGTYPSVSRPFYGAGAYFGYALKTIPLEFSLGLEGGSSSGTTYAELSARTLGRWPLGRVCPLLGISGGWSFQLPRTNSVSISSDPDFGWNRTYVHSSAATQFSGDGPFGEISAGAGIIAGSHEIRITVGYGLSVCYEGVWGKDVDGRAVRYGIIEKFENYPGIGSRYVWTEGRTPMKAISRLRLQISFSF